LAELAFLAEHEIGLTVKSFCLASVHTVGMEKPLGLVGNTDNLGN